MQSNFLTKVNFLLNRASQWLDVDSFLPVEGKVVLHIKDASRVAIRMPQWCDAEEVDVTINDKAIRPVIQGQYVHLSLLKSHDEVVLTFPVETKSIYRIIGDKSYLLTVRGSNIIDIHPKGVAYPLYVNQPTGNLVKKTRYVAQKRPAVW